MQVKEKQSYLYIGDDPDNSFTFWLSKIQDDVVIIVTDKGTPESGVYKVKTDSLNEKLQKGQLKELKWEE